MADPTVSLDSDVRIPLRAYMQLRRDLKAAEARISDLTTERDRWRAKAQVLEGVAGRTYEEVMCRR